MTDLPPTEMELQGTDLLALGHTASDGRIHRLAPRSHHLWLVVYIFIWYTVSISVRKSELRVA